MSKTAPEHTFTGLDEARRRQALLAGKTISITMADGKRYPADVRGYANRFAAVVIDYHGEIVTKEYAWETVFNIANA